MKALVTGAGGFVGGHLVDHLIACGHSVRCLVRNPDAADRLVGEGIEVIQGDISIEGSLNEICRGIDCVFHAAAKVSDWGQWRDFERDTVNGTRNMVTAAVSCGVSRFVHISSVDVYDRKYLQSKLIAVAENTPLVDSEWPYYYARAKMLAEREVFSAQNQILTAVIRPGTVYGPRDRAIFPKLIEYLRDKPILIRDSNPVLGMIHISDVASMCIKASVSPKSVSQAYNAVSDECIQLQDLIGTVCATLRIDIPRRSTPYWLASVAVRLSEGYARWTNTEPLITQGVFEFLTLEQRFDISKAKADLEWYPQVGFLEGIQSTLVTL